MQSEPRTGLISNNGESLKVPEQLSSEEENIYTIIIGFKIKVCFHA